MRGRKPISPSLRVVQGVKPRATTPRPALAPPKPPSSLSPAARREWTRLAPELHAADLLTARDEAAFASYCATRAVFDEAIEQLGREGLTFRTGDVVRPHPAVRISQAAGQELRLVGELFGLNPFSRHRNFGKPIAPDLDIDDVLGGPLPGREPV